MVSRFRMGHAFVLGCAVLAAGCERNGGAGAPAAQKWAVEPSPLVDITATDSTGAVAFLYAEGATRLSDGTLVVTDAYDASVRYFDPAGRPVRKVGRRGDGPGEFQGPGWVQQCGADSVYVWDYLRSRISVLDRSGNITREYPERENTFDLACSRTGTVAGMTIPAVAGPPNAKGEAYRAPAWLADTRGQVTRRLGVVNWGQNRPLGRLTHIAVTSDRVYVGTADSAFVDVYDLGGQRLSSIAVGGERRRPTRANYERAVDKMVGLLSSSEMRNGQKKQMMAIPMPDYLPPYSTIHADPSGIVWVNLSFPGDSATTLLGLRENGERVGEVTVPRELHVFEVGSDYVLGRYDDAEGEQHVAAYRFRRGA